MHVMDRLHLHCSLMENDMIKIKPELLKAVVPACPSSPDRQDVTTKLLVLAVPIAKLDGQTHGVNDSGGPDRPPAVQTIPR